MVVYLLGCLAQGIVLSLMVWFAARNIYKRMFNVVMGAPLHFFERNPIGRSRTPKHERTECNWKKTDAYFVQIYR